MEYTYCFLTKILGPKTINAGSYQVGWGDHGANGANINKFYIELQSDDIFDPSADCVSHKNRFKSKMTVIL